MRRDEIVDFLERYAESRPVREGVGVVRIESRPEGRFLLRDEPGRTSGGRTPWSSAPAPSGAAPASPWPRPLPVTGPNRRQRLSQPDQGCPRPGPRRRQRATGRPARRGAAPAGRDAVLACGRARGRRAGVGGPTSCPVVTEAGFFDQPRRSLPSPQARLLATSRRPGHGGGHDLHYRDAPGAGRRSAGALSRSSDRRLQFA